MKAEVVALKTHDSRLTSHVSRASLTPSQFLSIFHRQLCVVECFHSKALLSE
jgi:hypothetical protein